MGFANTGSESTSTGGGTVTGLTEVHSDTTISGRGTASSLLGIADNAVGLTKLTAEIRARLPSESTPSGGGNNNNNNNNVPHETERIYYGIRSSGESIPSTENEITSFATNNVARRVNGSNTILFPATGETVQGDILWLAFHTSASPTRIYNTNFPADNIVTNWQQSTVGGFTLYSFSNAAAGLTFSVTLEFGS